MQNCVPLKSTIKLKHCELDGNFKSKLLESSKKQLNNTTTREGYILDILSINKILSNKIKNHTVVFDLELSSVCIKMEKNQKVKSTVSLIFSHGIFADLYSIKFFVHGKRYEKF